MRQAHAAAGSRVPGLLTLKLRDPEASDRAPHYLDVRAGHATPRSKIDGGAVDGVLRAKSPGLLAVRAFAPAGGGARGRLAWDELEHSVGLSRTLRVAVDPSADVVALCFGLRELAGVEAASPVLLSQIPAPARAEAITDPWGQCRAREALEYEPGDHTLIVGVIDSGVDWESRELLRLRPGTDTVDLGQSDLGDVSLVGDYQEPDAIPRDEMGHGTTCASILSARGLRMERGVAGAAWVLPMRALAAARENKRGRLTAVGATLDIDHALKCAVDLGAKVLNLSFGTPASALSTSEPRPHADVVEYALARRAVLVAASGNDGLLMEYFPAALPGVIAVGSVGSKDMPSLFSTRGAHVALCAPGENVFAATLRGGYGRHTGTSFAAPFVTGTAALLCARAARYGVPLGPDEVKELLVRTARPFAASAHVDDCGAGILDARAALEALELRLSGGERATVGYPFRSRRGCHVSSQKQHSNTLHPY
jgi:subtilisin family serine protease